MAVNSNLFPPIVSTYAPVFLVDSINEKKNICRVYFAISAYNSLTDIKNVQVIVSNQHTNRSVLNKNKYPCEVMLKNLEEDTGKNTDDKYYIEIENSDITDGFQINQYYKIQLRFTSIEAEALPEKIGIPPTNKQVNNKYTDAQAIDSWLAVNLSNFSEWSTVCLARGISTPILSISGFEKNSNATLWSLNNVDVIGKINFSNSEETDSLKSYNIKLYKTETDELLTDSGNIYTTGFTNYNEINYTFKYAFVEGESYYFTLEYETMNQYTDIATYNFMIIQETLESFEANFTSIKDEENGRIGLHITQKEDDLEKFIGNLTIRRASSETDFTIWEDVHTASFDYQSTLDYTWWDTTVESGVYYKYLIQKRSSAGVRTVALFLPENPIVIFFDDMFLTGQNGQQLKIRFDPSISSFKRMINEAKVETIGSKYPFIKRNGAMEYREFPIGGTISCLMDEDNLFTSKEEIFKSNIDLYKDFNIKYKLSESEDWFYERKFREKVMDFLYDNQVKLFRSPTEGNILIKLTNINFTPNQTLGRRIYSFSATATEIDDATIENYDKYKISPLGSYINQIYFTQSYLGQIYETVQKDTNVIDLIQQKYKNSFNDEGYKITIQNFDLLRIEFEEDPYLIKDTGTSLQKINDIGNRRNYISESDTIFLGYLVYINKEPVIVHQNGVYQLNTDNIEISSITFPSNSNVKIDYIVNIKVEEDASQFIKTKTFSSTIGQLWGTFAPKEQLSKRIWNKYFEKYSNYIQNVISIDWIKIEADPNTVVYIKEVGDKDYEKHIIGPTGLLNINAEDDLIEDFYFFGTHLEEATEQDFLNNNIPNGQYYITNTEFNPYLESESKLIDNAVYTLTDYSFKSSNYQLDEGKVSTIPYHLRLEESTNYALWLEKYINTNNMFIWHNHQWLPFTEDNNIIIPSNAIVDYQVEIMKGRYNTW